MKKTGRAAVLGGAVCLATMPALAELPPALDRVPEDAALVVAVSNLQQFHDDLEGWVDVAAMEDPLEMGRQLLETPGLDAQGSVAMVLLPGADGRVELGAEPAMLLLAPVSDFDALAGGVGGQQADGLVSFQMQGERVFAKPIDGGYAAISPNEALVRDFAGAGGNADAHERRLGAVGRRAADGADVVAILDVTAFRPMIESGLAQMNEQLAMMGAMMGEQGRGVQQFGALVGELGRTFAEDAGAAVMAIDAGDGLQLDFATQFRDGTDAAEMLGAGGAARELLGRVPDTEFLIAGAMDMRNPELKEVLMELARAGQEMNPEQAQAMGFMNFAQLGELQDGSAFVMGEPAAIMMGGLWNKTVTFTRSDEPEALVEETAEATRELDGVSSGGLTFNTLYEPGAIEVAGASVDKWTMRMTPDPENPQGQQMAMQFNMMFGPQGMQGYTAALEGGTVTMMSQNAEFMASAIEAARQGNGLGAGGRLGPAAERLPEGAVAEAYVGAAAVVRQVANMAAMFGQPMQLDLPEQIDPLAMGLATGDGGAHGRIVLPQSLLETIEALTEQMGGGMAPAGAPPMEENPRF